MLQICSYLPSYVPNINQYTLDAGDVQIGPHTEISAEGAARHVPVLRPQAPQDTDQVPREAVEEEQHEDLVGYLPEGQAPPQR